MVGKRIKIALLAILAPLSLYAEFVSPEMALEKARSFFAQGTRGQVSQFEMVMAWPAQSVTKAATEMPAYYIFNRSDAKGFVIVSAESETPAILAYSNDGTFSTDCVGANPFLESYEKSIGLVRAGEKAERESGQYSPKLLETMNWNQNGVFFNDKYAPKMNSVPCMSGCVATAMAIILRYHSWPSSSTGYHEYECKTLGETLSYDYQDCTFAWDNMPQFPTDSASDEVSKLQKACGIAVNMSYGTASSSAYFCHVAAAVRKYFKYEPPVYLYRDSYTKNEWDVIVMDEINAGRPVFIGGYSSGDGHAYVIDGYDSNGLFHYNLGWGGQNNGYFREDLVAGQFAVGEAIVGITPRLTDEEDGYSFLTYKDLVVVPDGNISGKSVFNLYFNRLMNTDNEKAKCSVRADVYDENDNFKFTLQKSDWTVDLNAGYYYDQWSFVRVTVPVGKELSATDRIIFSSLSGTPSKWRPVLSKSAAFPHRTVGGYEHDGFIFSTLSFNNGKDSFAFSPMKVKPGGVLNVTVPSFYNASSSLFQGNIGLAVCDMKTMKTEYVLAYKSSLKIMSYSGYSDLSFAVTIPTAEKMTLTPDHAIALVAKSKNDTEYRIVCDYELNPIVICLQDIMDIDLSVPSRLQDSPVSIYSIDGRKVKGSSKGLYLQQFEGSKSRKVYDCQ